MQSSFVLITLAGAAYFAMARRRLDYLTLAFFSAVVYFLPGFFGVTSFHVEGVWREAPIHPEAYAVMIAVAVSILLSALVVDRLPSGPPIRVRVAGEATAVWFVAAFALAGLVGTVLTAGARLLDPEKAVVMEALGRWHILLYSAAIVGFAAAVSARKPRLAAYFLLLLLFDLYVGFRSPLAIAILSALLLVLHGRGMPQRMVRHWRYALPVLAIGILLFGYKHIAFAVKYGLWDLVLERLTSAEFYALIITRSEPFATQQILNDVIAQRFHTGSEHILSALHQLLVFAPELGADPVLFNDYFQPALFPEVDYGLASNIWAQIWSAGDWPLLIAFLIIFNFVLLLGNASLRLRNPFVRASLAPAFVYWAFYLHRNDLSYQINLEKRILLVLIAAILLAVIVTRAVRSHVVIVEQTRK